LICRKPSTLRRRDWPGLIQGLFAANLWPVEKLAIFYEQAGARMRSVMFSAGI
jgi:hypothetical protein